MRYHTDTLFFSRSRSKQTTGEIEIFTKRKSVPENLLDAWLTWPMRVPGLYVFRYIGVVLGRTIAWFPALVQRTWTRSRFSLVTRNNTCSTRTICSTFRESELVHGYVPNILRGGV